MNNPTIIIKYTCQESLERMPDIYIRNLKESILANADNNEKLEEIRIELINCRAYVDELQGRIWAMKNGFIAARRSYDE